MKLPSKSLALLTGAVFFSASSLIVGTASAESVSTDPVGYVSNFVTNGTEPATKEILVSAVLHQPIAFASTVDSIPSPNTIVLAGDPSWATNEFADSAISHYAVFSSGDREGLWAIISGN